MKPPPAPHRRRTHRLAAAALGLACLLPGSRALSKRIVFPTHRVAPVAPPADAVPISLEARDGVVSQALELPGPPDGRVLVHFHNNSETAAHGSELGHALQARGFGVLLVEYRGYGGGVSEEAEPSEEGLYLDAEAALDHLALRGIGPERVVLWGTSLGTGVAAEMARRGRGAALVLVTPYTSIPDIAGEVVSGPVARLLVPDHFDTLAKAPEIRVPTLIIHGDDDEIVPFWMGERLSREIPEAWLVRVPGGRHGDLFLRARERLLAAIDALGRRG